MSESQQQPEVTEQYAKIVTNEEEMEDLLSKIEMRGMDTDGQKISLVEDTILTFEDGVVRVKAFDPMKSVWCRLVYPFDDIRREGKLVIGDISEFLGYLSRFGEKTIVEEKVPDDRDTLHLMFNDEERKQGGYPADDEQHIDSVEDVEKLPYEFDPDDEEPPSAPAEGVYLDTWFTCPVSEILDILDDGDTTDVRKYPFSVDDGHVKVRVGDTSGYIETDFYADEGEGEAASVYAYGIHNVFSSLSGDATVYLSDDLAMWVHKEADDYQADYMIAEDKDPS